MSDQTDTRYEAGLKVRTEVLGAEHVARAQARQTPLEILIQIAFPPLAFDLDTGRLTFRPRGDRLHVIVGELPHPVGFGRLPRVVNAEPAVCTPPTRRLTGSS